MREHHDPEAWKVQRNRKAALRLVQRLTRQQREEANELARRYDDQRGPDDRVPPPRLD